MEMTFDFTPDQDARLAEVRAFVAEAVAPAAAVLDDTGQMPDALAGRLDAMNVWGRGAFDAVVAIEELSTASASAGARVALGTVPSGDTTGLAGLRGIAPVNDPTEQQQLGIAAVCLGIGRAALQEVLRVARSRGDRATGEPSHAPHWTLADAATDLDAARLLVRAAAAGRSVAAAASLVYAAGAASRAVDAALRILGTGAYERGSVLERCSRDVRAAQLILGTEDAARRQAADALLG